MDGHFFFFFLIICPKLKALTSCVSLIRGLERVITFSCYITGVYPLVTYSALNAYVSVLRGQQYVESTYKVKATSCNRIGSFAQLNFHTQTFSQSYCMLNPRVVLPVCVAVISGGLNNLGITCNVNLWVGV